ncbi:MAG: hypothetical protein HOM16_13940, partial [Woeseia sp.]|nr:hypothetical protein [Woeseia sp.]
MKSAAALIVFRMLPVIFVIVAAMFYVFYVEGDGAYPIRNTLPMLVAVGLALATLV